jgi:4-amino-4-deoxy-L-arabinose transferase-like glycosyltransferase
VARREDAPGLVLLAALTAVAFALRVRGLGEGLYKDELVSLADTNGRDLWDMLDVVANGGIPGFPRENNPPLFFVLAWLSEQPGHATETIRLPSLLLGTSCVPLVYLLGSRTVGRRAGLAGAALMALSPFAIFYGIEARAYASLMFFSLLSALALLGATRTGRLAWWAAYAASVAAVMLTHYTGVFVIAAEGIWTLWCHRERARSLLLAYVAAALVVAAWIPHLRDVGAGPSGQLARLDHVTHASALVTSLAGNPELPLSSMPSSPALVLLGAGLVVGLAAWLITQRKPTRPTPEAALVLALAISTPVCLAVYGAFGNDLFLFPRNMIASLPFAALGLGWVLTPPRRLAAAAATGLAIAGLGIGAARTLEHRFQRPEFPAVAQMLDARAGPRDPVVYYGTGFQPFALAQGLTPYYDRTHAIRGSDLNPASVERSFRTHGRRVFLVELQRPGTVPPPAAPPGWVKVEQQNRPGLEELIVALYEREARR